MSKSKKLFLLLSLIIALIDTLFVISNYFYISNTFKTTLQEESQNDYSIYKTVLEATYNSLSMQATLFAGDSRIQNLFLQGKKALEKEGGGKGGPETAKIRQELYNLVAESWLEATRKFDVRQLHFHLGPGSLTFLRVHKPHKFGDRMDNLRFIIVDTNATQSPHSGFETGRIYSGLRSVMPVFAWDEELSKKVYVGALEVGTSYKKLLQTIDKNMDIQLGILLNNQHIKNTVWDEFITGTYNNNTVKNCNCILEDSSRTGLKTFLEKIVLEHDIKNQLIHANHVNQIVKFNDHAYAITFHPLRDYRGQKKPERNNIGAIFIARDISSELAYYQENQWFNVLYGIIAYIIIELLLLITFFNVIRHLTKEVKSQTRKLSEQKRTIELDKIKYKNLAETINNNYFTYTRDINQQLSHVSSAISRVLGYTQQEVLSIPSLFLPPDGHPADIMEKKQQSLQNKNQHTFEVETTNKSGRLEYLLVTETPRYSHNGHLIQIEGLAQGITETRYNRMELQLRCRILQMISDNISPEKILKALTLGVEAIIQDIDCAIMLVNSNRHTLKVGSAPSLSKKLRQALNGLSLDTPETSSAIAASTSKRKIIKDLHQLSNKSPINKLLEKNTYKACSSEPVFSSGNQVVATIDIYYNSPHTPNKSDLNIITTATNLMSKLHNSIQ